MGLTTADKIRLRKVILGAINNYINAHGRTLETTANIHSLEKRITGAVYSALTTGQLEGTNDNQL